MYLGIDQQAAAHEPSESKVDQEDATVQLGERVPSYGGDIHLRSPPVMHPTVKTILSDMRRQGKLFMPDFVIHGDNETVVQQMNGSPNSFEL